MPTAAERRAATANPEPFAEKTFYLEEFHGQTLLLSIEHATIRSRAPFAALSSVLRELIERDVQIVLLVGTATDESVDEAERSLRRRLQQAIVNGTVAHRFPTHRGRPSVSPLIVAVPVEQALEDDVALVWSRIREAPLFVGLVPAVSLVSTSRRIAGRLRVHKWVVIEERAGLSSSTGAAISFMDDSMLTTVLREGTAEWAGLAGRRDTLEAIQSTLRAGVDAVNLCSIDGLATELYTYEGAGTLFTLEDYCRIDRLRIDDFEEVEKLLERGYREGYLKRRTPEETAQILANGFGAEIAPRHLAGVCGLLTAPFLNEQAGEIAALYTVTRFKTEGVGSKLLARVVTEARAIGLAYLFANTVNERARAFFERQGFRRVSPTEVPPSKWVDYDPSRMRTSFVLRRDL